MRILFAISAPISIVLLKGQAAYNKGQGADLYLATSRDEKFVPIIEREGFTFKELSIGREIELFKDIKAVFAAVKILNEVRPDVVNASTPKAGLIFMIACFFTGVKFPIFTLRGLRSATLQGVKGFVIRKTEWLSCFLAKKIIVISPSLKEYAIENKIVNRKKAIVIGKGSSNGINIERFNPNIISQESTDQKREEWNVPKDSFIFGYVGRIVKEKGIEEMYEAFKKIKSSSTFLVIVGDLESDDPISQTMYKEMKQDVQVRFIAFSNEIPLVMSAFDILILFSYREGFGNVALEGSCMGKPILVSNIIGLCDTVENGTTGFSVEAKDSYALSEKMKLYQNDEPLRILHGKNGRNRVLNFFNSNFIHAELYKIYQSGIN